MTTLTTDSFYAERQRNGDVWITSRKRVGWKTRVYTEAPVPSAILDDVTIIIPCEKCQELAQLLWPNVESDEEEWVPNYNQPHKVDYTHCEGEPE